MVLVSVILHRHKSQREDTTDEQIPKRGLTNTQSAKRCNLCRHLCKGILHAASSQHVVLRDAPGKEESAEKRH